MAGQLGFVGIGGDLIASATPHTAAISATGSIGEIAIHGDLTGTAANPVAIVCTGVVADGERREVSASIGWVSVGGDVRNALISAGLDATGHLLTHHARIAQITVRGNWSNGSVDAGVGAGAGGAIARGGAGQIDRIQIAGDLVDEGGRNSAFLAHQIGAFSAAGESADLHPGGGNDTGVSFLAGTGPVLVMEL
jgi:hypothetical protein